MIRDSIRFVECCGRKNREALEVLADEIRFLDSHPETETTLIIFTTGFKSFWPYLDLVDLADGWLDENQFRGIYQIASFHPEYCFEGEDIDSPSNFTNRSPYPMLHLLRESSLEEALSRYVHPENIPVNNVKKALEMGTEAITALLSKCKSE